MKNKFADDIAAKLQQYVQGQPTTTVESNRGLPLVPLHIRLQRLLDTIPPSVRHQGLSLLELQTHLRGRKGGLPHIGEMGSAMRRLGWVRRREWSNESTAFSSRWYPN